MLLKLLCSAVIFSGISWLLSLNSLTRKLAFIESPLILIVISVLWFNKLDLNMVTIGGALILFGVYSSGSHEYSTKDGKADKRYKNNPYTHTFSEEMRGFAASGLIGTTIMLVILFFAR